MNIHRFFACQILSVTLVAASLSYTNADVVSLIPGAGGYATGANINALAGPLFPHDIDSVDVAGPGTFSASADLAGNMATHSAAVELDFSGGGFAFFDSAYEAPFSRTASAELDHRASAESIYHFSVDVPTMYEAMGSFVVDDAAATTVPGNVELEILLLEFDAFDMPATVLFHSYQVSKETIDQGFAVGGMDGDTDNLLVGMPGGILDPAKVYLYRTLVTINAIDIDGGGPLPPTDGAATAMGAHVLLFSSPTGVPEPSSGCLIAFAILAVVARRRR